MNIFLKALSKVQPVTVPVYCTGYPESAFLNKFTTRYKLESNSKAYTLLGKDYNIIKMMGFDTLSIWDYRRGKGGYELNSNLRVDGWGRIYKDKWYSWKGVFKNEEIVDTWNHLHLPSKESLDDLKKLIQIFKEIQLVPVLSVPGLFEKTWQSMGFAFFAKCISKNRFDLINRVIRFFSEYIEKLIIALQNSGARIFIIADDCGYKKREFIPKDLWTKLYFKNYKKIINLVHQKRNKIILHSDGYISNLIDVFVKLGFDAIQSLEPDAGVDIFKLFEEFKDQICFIGNVSNTLLTYGTPQDVRKYVIKLISKARQTNTPLVISPTQHIDVAIKPENIQIMIKTTKGFKSD